MKTTVLIFLSAAALFAQRSATTPQDIPLNASWTSTSTSWGDGFILLPAYPSSCTPIIEKQLSGSIQYTLPTDQTNASMTCGSPYFPTLWAGYFVTWNTPIPALAQNTSVVIEGNVTVTDPSVTFDFRSESFNTCPGQAELTLYLSSGVGNDPAWYSTIKQPLAPGPFVFSVPISPAFWSDINGQPATSNLPAWKRALKPRQEGFGFTHGGGCFAGHGVRTKANPLIAPYPTATVTITRIGVNQ